MDGGRSTSILLIHLKHKRIVLLIALSAHWRAELHACARQGWHARLIAMVYEVNPLECVKCGSPVLLPTLRR